MRMVDLVVSHDQVTLELAVVEIEGIAEPRTAAGLDADAQRVVLALVLLGGGSEISR